MAGSFVLSHPCTIAPPHTHTHQGKQYGGSTVWGQEFTGLLAFTDFKSKETTYPWIRLALATCQMCASKQYIRDGISKLVNPSDFSKLKQKGMAVQVAAAEKLLMEAWQLCQSSPLTLDQKAQPMGRYLTRVALFLLGKGAKGPEAKVYKQLEEITDIFTAEMMSMGKYGKMDVTEPAVPLHSKHQCHVGWRQGGVQNAWVWSGASMPPFCQATADPAKIALASLKNLEVGKYYFFATEPLKVYKFESIDATKAVLLHKPFFGALTKKRYNTRTSRG